MTVHRPLWHPTGRPAGHSSRYRDRVRRTAPLAVGASERPRPGGGRSAAGPRPRPNLPSLSHRMPGHGNGIRVPAEFRGRTSRVRVCPGRRATGTYRSGSGGIGTRPRPWRLVLGSGRSPTVSISCLCELPARRWGCDHTNKIFLLSCMQSNMAAVCMTRIMLCWRLSRTLSIGDGGEF